MRFLRNPEMRRFVLAALLLWVAGASVGWLIDPACGYLIAGLGAVCIALLLMMFGRRYARIASLTLYVDRALHGGALPEFSDNREGEIAILQAEIGKMASALREQAELLQREKASLADSLYDISHQLKTPLTSMQLVTELLAQPDAEPARRADLMREMRSLLSRMDWLIAALLKISRIDAGCVQFKSERVPVDQLIARALEPFAIAMELRGIAHSVRGSGGAAFAGDLGWSIEAVSNIVKNCVEHAREGGSIDIRYHEDAIKTQITIHDNGEGIDPEDLPHIFDRFYRGKRAASGSAGIGLSLSRMIIAAQNGTVSARSDERGAEFTVTFYKRVV